MDRNIYKTIEILLISNHLNDIANINKIEIENSSYELSGDYIVFYEHTSNNIKKYTASVYHLKDIKSFRTITTN